MAKFNIPDRKYANEERKMVSVRLPTKLIKVLNEIAERKAWPLTDIVVTALDQYAQHEEKNKKTAK